MTDIAELNAVPVPPALAGTLGGGGVGANATAGWDPSCAMCASSAAMRLSYSDFRPSSSALSAARSSARASAGGSATAGTTATAI